MKILIKESQLENVIFKFLDMQLNPHEVVTFMIEDREVTYWVKDEKVIGEIEFWRKENVFWVLETIVYGLEGAFSLSIYEGVKYIEKYIKKYHGLGKRRCIENSMIIQQELYDEYRNKN